SISSSIKPTGTVTVATGDPEKILQGKDLPAKDLSGTSDPYVRVTLLPDKKHRLDTKIKRRTLNPRWNETFYFEGYPNTKAAVQKAARVTTTKIIS
ncbi:hypothetical protein DOY81_014100, partial [Sarcophaga bullata]